MDVRSPRRRQVGKSTTTWGDRPVLLLLGIRLGIDGVNPIYYETIRVNLFLLLSTFLLADYSRFNSFCIRSLNRLG